MMTYNEFAESPKGRLLASHVARRDVLSSMERCSYEQQPAVAALDEWAARELAPLTDTEKQHAGRIVRDHLTPRAWRVARSKRVRGARVFTSGAVYERAAPVAAIEEAVPEDLHGPDPLARARSALARSRIDPSKPLDTVDAFLAERRRMWGKA